MWDFIVDLFEILMPDRRVRENTNRIERERELEKQGKRPESEPKAAGDDRAAR